MKPTKKKYISPIWISVSHLLPSLLLVGLVIIGIVSLNIGKRDSVLGAQTTTLQIRTETVEDRINELSGVAKKINSEAVREASSYLRK